MARLIFLLVLAFVAYVAAYPSPKDIIQPLPGRVIRAADPKPFSFGFGSYGHDHIHPGVGHFDGHFHGGYHGGHHHGGHYDVHYPYGHYGPGHLDWHSDYY